MKNLYIDLHVLHTLPPSNINRDDTGSPKTAVYGGVVRSRVSSQAWKSAVRDSFEELLDAEHLGSRTIDVVKMLLERMQALEGIDDIDLADLAKKTLATAGLKLTAPRASKSDEDDKDIYDRAKYLVFIGHQQLDDLAKAAVAAHRAGTKLNKKQVQGYLTANHAADIALFGRMVADDNALNVDASTQVAHALSVHSVSNEFDFYTAVDDKLEDGHAGAGMLGTIEFNSATLYRYATINVNGLHKNLRDSELTKLATQAFVRAFITSMPTGKQNTFANRTLPDAVVVTVSEKQPTNLVNAFEKPVEATLGQSRLEVAAAALVDQFERTEKNYGPITSQRWVLAASPGTEKLLEIGDEANLESLVEHVGQVVAGGVGGE